MPVLFAGQVGKVIALEDPSVAGELQIVRIPGFPTFNSSKCLITRMDLNAEENFQLATSLGASIYIYSFGGKPGTVVVSGVSLGGGSCAGGSGKHGLESIANYYTQNRLSARKTELEVRLNTLAVRAFLVGMQASLSDPERGVGQFSLRLVYLPDNRKPSSSSGA